VEPAIPVPVLLTIRIYESRPVIPVEQAIPVTGCVTFFFFIPLATGFQQGKDGFSDIEFHKSPLEAGNASEPISQWNKVGIFFPIFIALPICFILHVPALIGNHPPALETGTASKGRTTLLIEQAE